MMKIKNTILLLVMMVLAPKAWALETDGEGYYIIRTVSDWNELADGINNGTITGTANARLYANIDGITKKIGYAWWDGQYIRGNSYYSGIFDGNGKTITVNLNGDDATVASDQSNGTHVAPFSHIKNATIKNICVKGTVRGKRHCSGLVSVAEGTNTITNAQISVDITATDLYCGGIIGQGADSNTTISDCLFNGSISIIGGCNAVSGIWGWSGVGRSHTANIQNCLENGTYSNITNNFNSIAIKNSDLNITTTNCFYTRANTTGNNYGTLATGTTLTDGTVTAALQNGREEVVWIQDPVTNKPTLKQFRNRINISKEGNGSISCNINATSNTSEEAVTLTVTPDVGYFLHEDDLVADVYVDGGNANARRRADMITELPITNNHDGTFTFTLPNKTYDYTVEVSAVFRAVNIGLSDDSFVYTGTPQTPVETVTFNAVTGLTKGTHYAVTYTDDVTNIGTKTVTITAIGSSGYWGTATKDYTITAKALEEDMITVGACTYTGNALTPDLTVQYNGMDIPFTPSWANNINAGTGQVTIVSTSDNYSGSIDKDFTIDPKSIGDGTATPAENITLTGIDESYVYTGSVIQPTVTLAYSQLPGDDKTVAASGNYTVSYTNESRDNVTVAKGGIVTVTGTGNYTGSIVKTFAITPKPFDETAITVGSVPHQTYNGTLLTPEVTLHDVARDVDLTQGTDFSVSQHKDAGTHTVTITALGNYQASLTADFTIDPKEVGLEWQETRLFVYDGTAKSLTATATGVESGDECTVTVECDVPAPTTVNSYTASATALSNTNYKLPAANSQTFEITQRPVTLAWTNTGIGEDTQLIYNGSAQKPTATAGNLVTEDECTVTVSGEQTNANTDATPTYTATASALSNSNYKLPDDPTQSFTISPKSIGDGTETPATDITLTGIDESYVYTGSAIQPTVTLAYSELPGDDKTVAASGNYSVVYTDDDHDNVTVDKDGIVTVTGTGNYTGSIVKEFVITPKPFDTNNFTISAIPNQTYNGTNLTPVVTLHDNDRNFNLTQGSDFSVTQHKDAGTHTVTITGLVNYQATLAADFVIDPKTVTLDWPNTVFDFDGTDQLPEAVVTNLEDGDMCSVTVTGAASAVGIHTATASALDNTNYQLPTAEADKSSDYEILKKLSFGANKVWMTFYDAAEGLVFSDDEERAKIETYVVTAVGADGVTLVSTDGKIYKDTPMLLKRTGDDLDIRAHQAAPVCSEIISPAFIGGLNSLAGYLDNDNYTVYILIGSEFLLADKEDTSMAFDPERCFIAINNSTSGVRMRISLVTGNGPTSIDNRQWIIDNWEEGQWYDLQGRRIEQPMKKGLYIRNGRKVVVK